MARTCSSRGRGAKALRLVNAASPRTISIDKKKNILWNPGWDDGCIPKKVLFGQLKTGVRKAGRPALRFMEANKRDLKTCEIDPSNWDDAASERARWRRTVKKGIENAGVKPCFTICSRILLSRGVA